MMRRSLAPILVSHVVLAVIVNGCAGAEDETTNNGRVCTDIGCAYASTLDARIAASPAELDGATVTACWRETCASALLPAFDEHGVAAFVMVADGVFGQGTIEDDGDDTMHVQIALEPPADLVDGDLYRLRVIDAGGRILLDGQKTTTYVITHPNGPECDPTCHFATVSFD
ncbi:MAG: hypothetical protein FWD69_05715 [Polyangiaceae bacterium]|nr:hypothetical protein [Polyangiaceae bacterium]